MTRYSVRLQLGSFAIRDKRKTVDKMSHEMNKYFVSIRTRQYVANLH